MYKVFFNERILTVAREMPDFYDAFAEQQVEQAEAGMASVFINHFLKSDDKNLILLNDDEKGLWKEVKSCFRLIKAAGGVVRKGEELLFIFRRGKWDLPKGKTDKGETPQQAALREVGEECGIYNLNIAAKLPSTWHIYQSPYEDTKGDWILKKTVWYEMDFSGDEPLIPESAEDIAEARWVKKSSLGFILQNTYPSLEPIIRRYC